MGDDGPEGLSQSRACSRYPPTVTSSADTSVSRTVLALSLAAFGSGLSQRVMDAMLPRLASDFASSLGAVAAVITCFTLGYAGGQLVFGPLGDRYGKLRVITASCLGCALGALACAVAPALGWLVLARAIAGAMAAAILPLAMAWIGDQVPYERRQLVLARFLVGQILGVASGQLLGGLAADHLGRQWPFVGITALFLCAALALWRVQRHLPAERTTQLPGSHPLRHLVREFGAVLARPWPRVVVMLVFAEGAAVFGAIAFFATHLHHELGVSLTAAGAMVMAFGAGGATFSFAARKLVPRLGEVGLARGGGWLMLASISGVGWSSGAPMAVLACFALGIGFYMLHNTLQTNATQMAPERRGSAVSLFALCYFLGQTVGVALAGVGAAHIGTRGVILVAAVTVLGVARLFARLRQEDWGTT